MRDRVLIIAEAGVNHNGELDLVRRMIDMAAEAGVDFVKFQTFSADRIATPGAGKASYQVQATGSEESQLEMLRRFELSSAMHLKIVKHCESRNVGFLSTGFDIESVDQLVALGQDRFKVPSGEITNLPYLRHIEKFQKPVIISTGMAEMREIEAAIDTLEKVGTPRSIITVLHCTTAYPTTMLEVNLRAMQEIHATFGVKVGYSDHTLGIEVPIAAVALGASVIEKHFTLDRSLPGPDQRASLEPSELKAMVVAIRNIETALGNGYKCPTPSELRNRTATRKSLVAGQAIKAGEIFSVDNIVTKRPGSGISPMYWDKVIGCTAHRDFAEDELIEL